MQGTIQDVTNENNKQNLISARLLDESQRIAVGKLET
jgi:hypothetical protein